MGAFKFRGAFNALSRFDARAAPGRRGRLLVGQPRAGDRAGGAPARHAGDDRHAARRTGGQGRRDAGLRRRGRASTTATAKTARRSARASPNEARHDADAAVRPSRRHRRPGHRGQGTDRRGRHRSTPCSSASAAAACSAARALATRASSPRCKLYGVEPEAGNDGQQSLRAAAPSCTSTRRRRSPTARRPSTWARSRSRSSAATSTTYSRPATPSWSRHALLRRAHEDRRRADRLPRLRRGAAMKAALKGKRVGVMSAAATSTCRASRPCWRREPDKVQLAPAGRARWAPARRMPQRDTASRLSSTIVMSSCCSVFPAKALTSASRVAARLAIFACAFIVTSCRRRSSPNISPSSPCCS